MHFLFFRGDKYLFLNTIIVLVREWHGLAWIALTVHVEEEPGAVEPGAGRPVGEVYPALVPALVGLSDAGQVDGAERGAGPRGVVCRRHPALVRLLRCQLVVRPREHSPTLK